VFTCNHRAKLNLPVLYAQFKEKGEWQLVSG